MTFTQSDGLRDREQAKFIACDTGSVSAVGIVLYALQSGTTDYVPVQCNANGMLLTSGI